MLWIWIIEYAFYYISIHNQVFVFTNFQMHGGNLD
jgi:hypothetical protein